MLKRSFCVLFILCLVVAMTPRAAQTMATIRLSSPFKAGHILIQASEKFKEVEKLMAGGGARVVR